MLRLAPVALAVFVAGCAHTRPEGPKIEKLEIKGTQQVKPRALKKKILTSESSWLPGWVPFLGEENYLDTSAWQADLRRIERYYQAHGFYSARVVEEETKTLEPDHVALSVTVKEGEPTTIKSIVFHGLDTLTEAQRKDVLEDFPLVVGRRFLEEDWQNGKDRLPPRLRELGFAEAVVEAEAVVDVERLTADLRFDVTPGLRYKFGDVFVAADPGAIVPPKRIAETVKAAVTPGDWYTESALIEAQTLVFQMNVFGAVKVNRGAPDKQAGTVPVVVDVREAPFHTLRAGGGFGIDTLRQEVRLIGEFTHRNFMPYLLGDLTRFTARGKVGWAFLPDVIQVATNAPSAKNGPVASMLFEIEKPRLFTRSLALNVSLNPQAGIEPAYGYYGGAFKAGVVWRPYSTLSVFPSYNLDLYWLTSNVPLGGNGPETLFGCPQLCVVSYLEQLIEWDRRDNRLEPHTGTYVALNLQEGGGPLGGAFTFFRIAPEVRGYVSFGKTNDVTLAGRLKVGTLITPGGDTPNDSPIIARFFSGGSSMRGFPTRRLSPLLVTPQPGEPLASEDPNPSRIVPGQTLPVGGKGLFEAALEARWNVWGDLVLAVFNDTGGVSVESLDFGNLNKLLLYVYTSVGLGVRYRTPVGPIRLDFAVRMPINGPQRIVPTDDPRFLQYPVYGGCFGIGDNGSAAFSGAPEGICSIQLSIGEAF